MPSAPPRAPSRNGGHGAGSKRSRCSPDWLRPRSSYRDNQSRRPGIRRWPLAVFLPILLWAALRFGPEGVALSLLATAVLTLGAATHGIGPFGRQSADEGVQTLQIFLIVVAIPLMCAGALDKERRRAERAISERLQFEELLCPDVRRIRRSCRAMRYRGHSRCGSSVSHGFFASRDVLLTLYDESQQAALAQWDALQADPHPGFRSADRIPSASRAA